MPRRTTSSTWTKSKGTIYTVAGALALVAVCVLVSCYVFGQRTIAPTTVKLVTVIFRHGDRTPTSFYPNDPHKDPSNWPDGLGALTKTGKQQMYKLGKFIRYRYDGFLSERYASEDVYVFSSDHDRCLMSAELCLAGLYPPFGDQIWNKKISWQPIPVHTIPRNLDKLIIVGKPCPKYQRELNETYHGEFFSQVNAAHVELYKYLSEKSGKVIEDVMGVEALFNVLEVEKSLNLPLPEWAEKKYYEMKKLAELGLASFTFTNATKRLKGGPLLSEAVQHMSQKVLGLLKPNRNLYLYSGHDVTVVSVLRALGIEDIAKPEYGATVIFELHQIPNEGDHSVEVWYLNNTEQSDPVKLHVPGCEAICKLKDFIRIAKPSLPENWEKECHYESEEAVSV